MSKTVKNMLFWVSPVNNNIFDRDSFDDDATRPAVGVSLEIRSIMTSHGRQ